MEAPLTLGQLADRLKLSTEWLRAEALAGRIPSLLAGKRLLFNAEAVERVLLKRAAKASGGSADAR